jgi:hypothetical protein
MRERERVRERYLLGEVELDGGRLIEGLHAVPQEVVRNLLARRHRIDRLGLGLHAKL